MNLQCVPSTGVDQNNFYAQPPPPSNSSNSLPFDVPSLELDYEVAELTWANGQLTMHGLGPPRHLLAKTPPDAAAGGGTLESLVDQATRLQQPHHKFGDIGNEDLAPWFDYHRAVNSDGGASAGITMDALVPCDNNNQKKNINRVIPTHVMGSVLGIGSCSGTTAGIGKTNESATCQKMTTLDTSCNRDRQLGSFTFATSDENTNSGDGKDRTKTSGDDHDSDSQREEMCGKKCGSRKSSISTKSSRAAAIHNQSERKRRDRINERMRTLQKLVPYSSKTDKASMLDEVIVYLKQLQTQVQLMSRMVPLVLQQQLQMSMMAPMAGIGMGMGMGMGMPPLIQPFLPLQPSWDNARDRLPVIPDPNLLSFFASQSPPQATSMEAYGRLAAFFQQYQLSMGSGAGSGSKN